MSFWSASAISVPASAACICACGRSLLWPLTTLPPIRRRKDSFRCPRRLEGPPPRTEGSSLRSDAATCVDVIGRSGLARRHARAATPRTAAVHLAYIAGAVSGGAFDARGARDGGE